MRELYSIGEVSKIMGVSIQALRYYSSNNILNPKYVNPSTGYRYYSADQLHFIDRIKYLQKFGLSLKEISTIINDNDITQLLSILKERELKCHEEINKLNETIENIKWYKNYFKCGIENDVNSSSDSDNDIGITYTKYIKKRYMVATKIIENEPKEDFHIRLHSIKNSKKLSTLKYIRQFSYLLNFHDVIEGTLKPTHLGMFISKEPRFENPNILTIPEGNYFCFKARILSEGWDPKSVQLFFNKIKENPPLILANEYEDDLHEYSDCIYEMQILIPDSHPTLHHTK